MIKVEFLESFIKFSVSHDHSEITLICCFAVQGTHIIIIIVEDTTFFLGFHNQSNVKNNSIYKKKKEINKTIFWY